MVVVVGRGGASGAKRISKDDHKYSKKYKGIKIVKTEAQT